MVVPAYNEAAVLKRALTSLLEDACPGEFEVIVVANGCSDDTAAIARSFEDRGITVLETPIASKVSALNLANRVARHDSRIYLDADVELRTSGARALFEALEFASAVVASPRLVLTGCSGPATHYWRAWSRQNPSPKSGTGCYGLSRDARSRLGTLPEVLGDDEFVAQHLLPERIPDAITYVYPPRTLRASLRRRIRIERGNAQLDFWTPKSQASRADVNRPGALIDIVLGTVLLVGVHLTARVLSRLGIARGWAKDSSSRSTPRPRL